MSDKRIEEAVTALFRLTWAAVCVSVDAWAIVVLWPHPAGVALFLATGASVAALIGMAAYEIRKSATDSAVEADGGTT